MAEALVAIEKLAIEFQTLDGPARVLKDVSLNIAPGEVVGLVGESGSGKSVTAKFLLGALPASTSRIVAESARLFGKDLMRVSEAEREALKRLIAYIPQDPMGSLNQSFKIGVQMVDAIIWGWSGRKLASYLIQRRRPSQRRKALDYAAQLLEKVQIVDPRLVLDRYPTQLSGGMRQRVLIALAISGSPQLLIADEPTTALDVTVQKKIVEIIHDLVERERLAGLYITHDLGVARELCGRTYVMYRGQIMESGPTAELLSRPQHPYTRRLVDAIPRLSASGAEQEGEASSAEPILRLRSIEKTFVGVRTVQAVKPVSFDVLRGETFAIVGESGSGKSTLAQILARVIQPSAGAIELNGQEITEISGRALRDLRRIVQMVFQDPGSSLNPRQTIEEIISLPLKLQGGMNKRQRRDRVTSLLSAVHLPPDMMRRTPPALSGGQKQRISIARSLALNPKMLILDEPTSALDVSVQARILELLKELKQTQGLTYVLITHDLGVVRAIADRIAVMYRGSMVEIGTADQVILSPRDDYTRILLSAVPVVHEEDRLVLEAAHRGMPRGEFLENQKV